MSRSIKARLVAFVVLSAFGIVYITASLPRLHRPDPRPRHHGPGDPADLGRLYEGSQVTYRGVQDRRGLRHDRRPARASRSSWSSRRAPSSRWTPRCSCTTCRRSGEQYLDFEPPRRRGAVRQGRRRAARAARRLPPGRRGRPAGRAGPASSSSVDKENLQVVVKELGAMFEDTGVPLQNLLDNGSQFVDEASAHTDETIALLDNGLTVLRTQQGQGENIRSFSRDLRLITDTLRESDGDLRGRCSRARPGAARELTGTARGPRADHPGAARQRDERQQVVVSHLRGLEQLLVTFPRVISGGFTGTPAGRLRTRQPAVQPDAPPCTDGYKPSNQWRPGQRPHRRPDLSRRRCPTGPPFNCRGLQVLARHRPTTPTPGPRGRRPTTRSHGAWPTAPWTRKGSRLDLDQSNISILGDDSWKWLLVGPVAGDVRASTPRPSGTPPRTSERVRRGRPGACVVVIVAVVRARGRRRGGVLGSGSAGEELAEPRPTSSSGSATSSRRRPPRRGLHQHPLRRRAGRDRPGRRPARRGTSASSTSKSTGGVIEVIQRNKSVMDRRGALGRRGRRRRGQRDRHRGHQRHRRQQPDRRQAGRAQLPAPARAGQGGRRAGSPATCSS